MKKRLKTITLSTLGNPTLVLCPGHVTQKIFNDAFKNEGWSERGNYKQKDLRYGYWKRLKKGNYRISIPGKHGSKPFTFVPWD